MKIVSACLAGINCTYRGDSNSNKKIIEMVEKGEAIPVCPEQLGGLPTPRIASEGKENKVFNKEGKDVTLEFNNGAKEALKIAKMINCKEAILKARSPSCGCGEIYDGTFSKKLIKGDGVFTKLLKENKIIVRTEEEI